MNRLGVCLVGGAVALALAGPGARGQAGAGDPLLADQWALAKVGAPSAWETGIGDGVTIAVVDTGIDLDHNEFAGKIVAAVSCIGADDDPDRCTGGGGDDVGHGTHVAGIAAAANNGVGVSSIAPGARIMSVKVLEVVDDGDGDDDDGDGDPNDDGAAAGTSSDVRAGVRWAVAHGADVINLSLGGDVAILNLLGSPLDEAINDAWAAGVIPVVAAGNDALFPTGYHSVDALVVTATDKDDHQASYASSVAGASWALAAPGGDGAKPEGQVLSTWWPPNQGDAYGYMAGTSMAAPHVSGAAAVLLSLGLTPEKVVDRLLDTAVDLGAPGPDGQFGAGRLDVAAAVSAYTKPGLVPTTLPSGSEGTTAAAGQPGPRVEGATASAPASRPPASGGERAVSPAPTTPAPAGPIPPTDVAAAAGPTNLEPRTASDPSEGSIGGPALAAALLLAAVVSGWVVRRRAPHR